MLLCRFGLSLEGRDVWKPTHHMRDCFSHCCVLQHSFPSCWLPWKIVVGCLAVLQTGQALDDSPGPGRRRWCRNGGNLHHNVSVCVPDGNLEGSIGSLEFEVNLGRGLRHEVVVNVQGPSVLD